MTVVGFVGLGNMGQPMATNVARAGFDLVCFDAAGTHERLPPGATAAADLADLFARADTVLLSVPDGAATIAIVDEIVATAERRLTTVVDLSTVGPQVAGEVAERLQTIGVTYTDGPVSGGVAGARAATISMMFAGPADVLETNRPVLETIAANVFHVGTRAGQGQAMKLLNNYLSATALAATSEAIAFGVAEGLDMGVILDVLNASTGRNSATTDKFPNRVMTGSFDAGFHTRLMAKDVRLFLDSVARMGTAATVAESVSDVWQRADEAMPGSDFTQIWQFVSGR
ncbi:MAG TPA: NAD(P)-dependent oxidoreductase [Ilumatobacteraceae bacterium]|nr:NAD(P)-dependent oxidoreductase [Ilumatobacteraceae bacterium]